MSCVKLHPKQDLDDTLANNIALIKLDFPTNQRITKPKDPNDTKPKDPKDVVIFYRLAPGDGPEELATGTENEN